MIAAEYLLLKPNWTTKVVASRKWETSIQTALSGREIRSALFTWPRRSIRYLITGVSSEETNMIKRRIFKSLPYPFGVPYWPDGTELTQDASSGQAVLNVTSTAYRNFEVGGLCAVMDRSTNGYEAGTIQSITGTTITLTANLAATWTMPADVWPVIQCRFKSEQSVNMMTGRVGQIRIDAEEVFDPDITYMTHAIPAAFPEYRQMKVMNTPPNWVSRVEVGLNHPSEWITYLGKSYFTTYRDETEYRVKIRFTEFSREEVYNFCEFFDACKGRYDHFWTPTWNDDVSITGAFSPGATSIPVADYFYTDYWEDTEITGKHLRVSYPNGNVVYTEVTGQSGGSITVDPGLTYGCTQDQSNSMLVSFMILSRFASDTLQLSYPAETIANITSEFKSVYHPLGEGGGVPPLWQGSYEFTSWQGNSYGWTGHNLRVVIPAASFSASGSAVRVTLGYYDTDYDIAAVYIGHQASSGDTIDFDGSQAQVLFSGSGSATVSTGGLVSDTVTFALDDTKNVVVAMYFSTVDDDLPSALRSAYAGELWYYSGANETSTTDVDATGNYTDYSSTENIDVIEKIEIYAG